MATSLKRSTLLFQCVLVVGYNGFFYHTLSGLYQTIIIRKNKQLVNELCLTF